MVLRCTIVDSGSAGNESSKSSIASTPHGFGCE